MDIKELGKASKLLDKLKVIDADIIEIEKIAQLLASGNSKQSMVLAVTDTSPETEPKKQVLDSDGSLTQPSMSVDGNTLTFSFFGLNSRPFPENRQDNRTKKLDVQLSDTTALQVWGVLLEQKLIARGDLIKKLENLGFEFKN